MLGLIFTLPLMAGEWVFHLDNHRWFAWLSLLFTLPVQFIAGARFYRGAWQQLKVGHSNMDTLVALGSTAAFCFSIYGLFAPGEVHHLYFMEAGAIITLISIGHYMEARGSERAAVAVRELLTLAPESACRLAHDGREEMVPVSALLVDDRVALRPGDRIPTDGLVEKGGGAVDESMLTGESVPVDKAPGAELYAGTANQNGLLVMRVRATGEATALARIIQVVERAQNSRAGIERLADRVSSIFVPAVILIAIATMLAWTFLSPAGWHVGIINAVAVLIVACPCAMGLATPAAIMAGANAAAKRGILIRDGTALEKCGRLTAVLFDKTGTLTEGNPRVTNMMNFTSPANGIGSLARALAEPSKHPFSQAVADYFFTSPRAAISNWKEERGAGVSAEYAGEKARLGSLRWLRECGIDMGGVPANMEGTVLGVTVGSRLAAAIALVDSPKPNAGAVVAELKKRMLRVHLVSGDTARTARAVGTAVGIPDENIHAEIRPEAKAGIVEKLQREGQRVAFIGDGINDAPALAQADLGIAVTRASDVARESADILLLKNDIEAIPEALGLCVAALRTIKQNLFWAFFYNAAAIPLAATGWLSPIFCAGAMALSDLFVIGNALRLLRWKSSGQAPKPRTA